MNFFYDILIYNPQELVLSFFIITGLLLSLFNNERLNKFAYLFALFGIITAILSTLSINITTGMGHGNSFTSSNLFSVVSKTLILFSALLIIILSRKIISEYSKKAFEFVTLIFSGVLGACCLVISNDFLTAFVSLEMLSVSGYLLVGFTKTQRAKEASIKYLIQSCFASALLLFGVSYIYGLSGSIDFYSVSDFCFSLSPTFFYPALGLLTIMGIMFKLGCVPFTNWIPDIYEGASYPVGAFISLVPKIAGFAFLVRILAFIFPHMPIATLALQIIAVISVIYGVFGAISQTNIKRLWGYSSIIQSGFILCAVSFMTVYSLSSVLFYLGVYIFMNLGVWCASYQFNINTGSDLIADNEGLYKKRPYFSIAYTICLISLAGLPLTAGFLAKIYLFSSIIKSGLEYFSLLFILLLLSLGAIFAYFNVIKNIFVSSSKLLSFPFKYTTADMLLYFCAFLTIVLCLIPNSFIKISQIVSFYIN
ncbi:NADH-quinone oxidoreductase subunit N [bacterium]|nr:NADH-quinone oxidoreductase subunit N [bacterium]